jgi:hypothetical protein
MLDIGIIRHRGKINAAINNAQCFIEIQKEFGSFSTEGSPRIFYLSKSTILIESLDIRDRTSLNS